MISKNDEPAAFPPCLADFHPHHDGNDQVDDRDQKEKDYPDRILAT